MKFPDHKNYPLVPLNSNSLANQKPLQTYQAVQELGRDGRQVYVDARNKPVTIDSNPVSNRSVVLNIQSIQINNHYDREPSTDLGRSCDDPNKPEPLNGLEMTGLVSVMFGGTVGIACILVAITKLVG